MRSIAVFFLVATTAVVDAGEVQLKIPVEPRSRAQPKVRATTEISSGPRVTSRKSPFQGLRIR